jgi:hypothetical protein
LSNGVLVDIRPEELGASFHHHARTGTAPMNACESTPDGQSSAVSTQVLRRIAEQGFFGSPGCLADARSACSELLFARTIIEAQTARIAELTAPTANS